LEIGEQLVKPLLEFHREALAWRGMGLDYVPARPRPDADLDEVRRLAGIHSRHVQTGAARSGGWAPIEQYTIPEWSVGEVRKPATDPSTAVDRLRSRLEIVPDTDGNWPCFRANVIAYNPLFPVAWRKAALTTMLPDEASGSVDRWRRWYGHVTAGRMSHYLGHLLAWQAYQELLGIQAELIQHATATVNRTNAWAQRDALRQACQRIFELPEVPPLNAPAPPPAVPDEDVPDAGRDEAIRALAAHIDRVGGAVRDFNRAMPRGGVARRPEPFDPAHRPVRDEWLKQFFDWIDPFLRTGHGLYLWD
jgi:hypothetical protein